MLLVDFQSETTPVHSLFEYSGSSKKDSWEKQWFSAYVSLVISYIKNNAWRFLGHEYPKTFIRGNECIILLLTLFFISGTQNFAKNNYGSLILPLSLRQSFLTYHCDITTLDLWRHADVGCWHCDLIFVDYFCTPKLAQMRSSLVNNSHEYRFLTTRYSCPSV